MARENGLVVYIGFPKGYYSVSVNGVKRKDEREKKKRVNNEPLIYSEQGRMGHRVREF